MESFIAVASSKWERIFYCAKAVGRILTVVAISIAAIFTVYLIIRFLIENDGFEAKFLAPAAAIVLVIGFIAKAYAALKSGCKYCLDGNPDFDHIDYFLSLLLLLLGLSLAVAAHQYSSHEKLQVGLVLFEAEETPIKYLTFPWLQFAPASLKDKDLEYSNIKESDFYKGSIDVPDDEIKDVISFTKEIQRCAGTGHDMRLLVYGLASIEAYFDSKGIKRTDSDLINLRVANLRAKNVVTLLEQYLNFQPGIVVSAHVWDDIDKMSEFRDGEALTQLGIYLSTARQGRAAVIQIDSAGKCIPMLVRSY